MFNRTFGFEWKREWSPLLYSTKKRTTRKHRWGNKLFEKRRPFQRIFASFPYQEKCRICSILEWGKFFIANFLPKRLKEAPLESFQYVNHKWMNTVSILRSRCVKLISPAIPLISEADSATYSRTQFVEAFIYLSIPWYRELGRIMTSWINSGWNRVWLTYASATSWNYFLDICFDVDGIRLTWLVSIFRPWFMAAFVVSLLLFTFKIIAKLSTNGSCIHSKYCLFFKLHVLMNICC